MSLIPWIFDFLASVYIETDIETTSLSDHFAQDTIFWNVKSSNNWNQLFATKMWKCALQQFSFENWMMIWTQLASYLNLTFILDKNIFEHNLLFFCSIKNNIFICPSTASWKCILPRGQLCHYGRMSKLLASVSVTLMFWGSQKILRRTPERTHILFLIIKYIDPI